MHVLENIFDNQHLKDKKRNIGYAKNLILRLIEARGIFSKVSIFAHIEIEKEDKSSNAR